MTDNDALVREKRLWKVICSLEAMSRNYAGGHMWDHLDGEMVCEAAALLRDFAALRSTPQPKPLDPPAQGATVREFVNELGNRIRITIEGPTSISENVLTPAEVDELGTALSRHTKKPTQDEVEALREENARLRGAALEVISAGFDHYTARNGRRCSIEGGDGEKCWIVPFDQFEALRAALEGGAK